MTAPRFVLASASPARLTLLRAAGLDPEVVVSGADEDDVSGSAAEVAQTLATRKATAVATGLADGVVLGCDSVLELAGEALGKPTDRAEATTRWKQMRGKTGTLITGHCLIRADTAQSATATVATSVRFGRPSDEEIALYVRTSEPLRVAGGFTIDGLGSWFIDAIDGDHGNVIGVSLPTVRRLFAEVGRPLSQFWPQRQ